MQSQEVLLAIQPSRAI
nr:unnamed protein product [Callosobruchus chinensis]